MRKKREENETEIIAEEAKYRKSQKKENYKIIKKIKKFRKKVLK